MTASHVENDGADSEQSEWDDKASVATKAAYLARDTFDLGISTEGTLFALPKEGPKVALMGERLRERLAMEMAFTHKAVASPSALDAALLALKGEVALYDERTEMHLRVARHEGNIVIDLGDATGRAVVITPAGWEVVERPPVVFRRTATTKALPEPVRGGDLSALRSLFPVSESDWGLLVGLLVAGLFADIAHVIAAITGPQGAAKSTIAKIIIAMVDPSLAPLRTPPRDSERCIDSMQGTYAVAYDNLTRVEGWFSSALCRAATGDSDVRRALYSNDGLAVFSFRRFLVLTGIDLGRIQGDLADRFLSIELETMDAASRRPETEVVADFDAAYPEALGALYDTTAKVLAALPTVDRTGLPRMADFGLALRALDATTGSQSFAAYATRIKETNSDLAEGDPFVAAIQGMLRGRGGSWSGSAGDLVALVKPPLGDRRLEAIWPADGRVMAAWLKRTEPFLKQVGVDVVRSRSNGKKMIRLNSDLRGPAPSAAIF